MKKKKKPKGANTNSKKVIIDKQSLKKLYIGLGVVALFLILAINISAYLVRSYGKTKIVSFEEAPTSTVIMVLGASVKTNGQPGKLLQDRLDLGIDLFNAGKAPYILITGDDGLNRANEIYVMQKYLLSKGIPLDKIVIDGHGYRTYESCKRANEVFHIEDALIVTQAFHLPRATFLCERFDITSHGVKADKQKYDRVIYNNLRDWLASSKAWIDTHLWVPEPPVFYYEKQ
jgi:SanA protein